VRYLIVSDLHSNLEALEAVTAAADFDRLVFLGDAVDYGPDPEAIVDFLRSEQKTGALLVRGNHDEAVAVPEDEFDDSWWSEMAVQTLRYSRKRLEKGARAMLGGLPLTRTLDLGPAGRGLLCHGSPASNLEYLWPDSPNAKLESQLGDEAMRDFDFVFVGHSHLPFERRLGRVKLVNPGSVGQPRDGDPRAAFALFDSGEGLLTFHRAEYPVAATAGKIRGRAMPLAERLVAILESGGGLRAGASR
jgi:predicted phosphodiesterase